ncbi:MAG: DUF4340 domain-containing protein [Mobilitalea sp.]
MTKRKKRNSITMVSLLLALAVLVGIYAWYMNRDVAEDTTDTTIETISLGSVDTEQISSLHYVAQDADLTFVLQGDAWISEDEPERPINQDNVANMISSITDISATRLVTEVAEDIAEYGLAEPAGYLQAIQEDGTVITLQIGDEVIGAAGYYALVNDDKKVYIVTTSCGTALQYTNLEMTQVMAATEITAENIYHIEIMNRDGEDFELVYDPNNQYEESSSAVYSWVLLKPYAEGYSANDEKVSDLLANYAAFTYTSCVDYSGKDLSKYGLEDPAASIDVGYYVTSTETLEEPVTDPNTGEEITEKTVNTENELKIYVGNLDEDGEYYVKAEGSDAVYTMAADTVNTMLQVDAFSIISTYVCIPNIDDVDKITVDADGVINTMEIKRTTSTNTEGEEAVAVYYHNDKEVTEDLFKGIYQDIIVAQYDAEAEEVTDTTGMDPYMTITYQLNDDKSTQLTASFLPYDDSFYLVDTGTGARFYADKRKIEDIASTVAAFTGTEE